MRINISNDSRLLLITPPAPRSTPPSGMPKINMAAHAEEKR
jgi:hypothetical protein